MDSRQYAYSHDYLEVDREDGEYSEYFSAGFIRGDHAQLPDRTPTPESEQEPRSPECGMPSIPDGSFNVSGCGMPWMPVHPGCPVQQQPQPGVAKAFPPHSAHVQQMSEGCGYGVPIHQQQSMDMWQSVYQPPPYQQPPAAPAMSGASEQPGAQPFPGLTQDQLQALEQDPELAAVFQDIKRNGPAAALRAFQDEELMMKISKKIGQGTGSEAKQLGKTPAFQQGNMPQSADAKAAGSAAMHCGPAGAPPPMPKWQGAPPIWDGYGRPPPGYQTAAPPRGPPGQPGGGVPPPQHQQQQQQPQPQLQQQLPQGQQQGQQMVTVMMPNNMANQMAQQAGQPQAAQGQPGQQVPQMMQGMQMPQGAMGAAAMSGAAGSSSSGQNGAMQGQGGADRSMQQLVGSGGTLTSDNLPANATLAGGNFPPGTINLGPGMGPGGQPGYYVAIPIGPAAPQGGGGVAAAPGNWAPGGPGGFVQMPDGFSGAGGSRPGFGGDDGDFGGRGRTGFGGRGGFDAGKGSFGAGKGAGKGFMPQQKFARTGNADIDDNWRSRTAADAEAAKDAMAGGADFGAPAA